MSSVAIDYNIGDPRAAAHYLSEMNIFKFPAIDSDKILESLEARKVMILKEKGGVDNGKTY